MPKFTAPAHVTSISLSSGPVEVIDGVAEIHLLTPGDVTSLRANGFELIAEGAYFAVPAPEPDPEPVPGEEPASEHDGD
jgi:hypothetical protein